MPLAIGQYSVRDLIMGRGTPYRMHTTFNAWKRMARVTVEEEMPYSDGSWAGAEFTDSVIIPMRVITEAGSLAEWEDLHHALIHAFRPIGTASEEIELRWNLTGREYVMFGRPRSVEPDVDILGAGTTFDQCAFKALDPRMFSGTLHNAGPITVPTYSGGLTLPLTVPFSIDTVVSGGEADATTSGLQDAELTLVLSGPLTRPRVIVRRADGTTQIVKVDRTIPNDWTLTIDTRTKTAVLSDTAGNKYDAATEISGDWPTLTPGDNLIGLRGSADDTGTLTAYWRDTWRG